MSSPARPRRTPPLAIALALGLGFGLAATASAQTNGNADTTTPVARGAYLVHGMGCADCHTPLKMGAKGPEPDLSRGLSGHPQGRVLQPPALPAGSPGGVNFGWDIFEGTVCHEPHSSRLASLQRGTQPGACLACHDKPLKTADGAPVINMAAFLAANPDRHGPIREGDCTACHNPHAGKNFRMLVEDYPPQFYAPFKLETFKLCFKCHIPDLVLKPSGQGLTQFRNGDRNLHWVHVNQEKGRTCRACHEVHASKRPAHIREAVPFGSSGWLLELNYEQTAEGGRCSPGCHTTRSYNRSLLMPAIPARPSGATP